MYDVSWHDEAAKQARMLQIIVPSLVMGCTIFLVIAVSIGPVVKPPRPLFPIPLTWIACAFAGIDFLAWAVVMRNITAKARRDVVNGVYKPVDPGQGGSHTSEDDGFRDAKYLVSVYPTRTIVGAAMFEGLGFFATIAYLLEGNPLGLGLAVLMILGVAAHFPTQSRIIGWVERQLEAIEQEKMMR